MVNLGYRLDHDKALHPRMKPLITFRYSLEVSG